MHPLNTLLILALLAALVVLCAERSTFRAVKRRRIERAARAAWQARQGD